MKVNSEIIAAIPTQNIHNNFYEIPNISFTLKKTSKTDKFEIR